MRLKILEIKQATNQRVTTCRDAYEILKEETKADRECFWVLHLNTQGYVIEKELVAMGTLNCVHAEPREIFKNAIINSAKTVILVHNHPSGIPLPSEADEECHQRLSRVGDLLGIKMEDYVIIGRYGYFSFFEDTQKQREYSGQLGLFVEQEIKCVRCGEWVKKENVVEWNGLSYCAYCWEVCFGNRDVGWIPEVD